MSKVIDMRTRKALFSNNMREQLEEGLRPKLQVGVDPKEAVSTVEQILCTALVSAAVACATGLAGKLADKITSRR